jgi:4-amino-4-deoxy-L-arabinose transferase-like glycosyltransferase
MAADSPVDSNAPPVAASTLRMTSRRHLLLLLAIIVLAIGLRLAWIAYVNPSPFDGRADDTAFYAFAGKSLAGGHGYTNFYGFPTAQWPPAYPFLLASLFKVFGTNIVIPKIVNALAGGLTCLLIYLIAAKVFDRRIGLLGGFLFAIFPGQIFFSTLLMTESLTPALLGLMLLLLLMWVVERKDARWFQHATIGVLFGVALLARGEAVMLVLAALLIWKLAVPAWRLFARQAGVFLVAAALTVLPWTIRNAVSMHSFVPVSTALGHTMLAGHQPDIYSPWRLFPETKYQEQYKNVPFPEREIKVENAAQHEALEFIVHHPVEESYYPFIKFYHLFKSDSEAVAWVNAYMPPPDTRPKLLSAQEEDRFAVLANVYYVILMVCASVGLPLWFSFRDKRKLLLMLFAGAWVAIHLALWPSGRYHVALTPIFCLWAALSLVTVYDWLAEHRRRVVAAAAARGTARGR